MWDQRYNVEEYVYGEEPNEFLKAKLDQLTPGRLLLPAEGEGRNAVYAARQGWKVTAFDNSVVGMEKAKKLAEKHQVYFHYLLSSYDDVELEEASFDVIALIYAHSPERKAIHRKMLRYLKQGGLVLLEGFSKEQLDYGTGGPNRADMLFSNEELQSDFTGLSEMEVRTEVINLDEGEFHQGKASVVRFIGKK